jgi:hypothetical protein
VHQFSVLNRCNHFGWRLGTVLVRCEAGGLRNFCPWFTRKLKLLWLIRCFTNTNTADRYDSKAANKQTNDSNIGRRKSVSMERTWSIHQSEITCISLKILHPVSLMLVLNKHRNLLRVLFDLYTSNVHQLSMAIYNTYIAMSKIIKKTDSLK